ncbi:putative nucleic acid-binding protein [Mucilaginibacter terrae]|uniref:Nucleic acid-binding protein n=1 Tax=Mucilaginibacter terrae TaxID=1955052 RepID=A0ABU3GUL5_9SPHI|nr:putative nucleic acid-binding protein [Mucilaginibacter terrae]
MNGNKLFVDTNICIYLLNDDHVVADLLNGNQIYISFITEIELCLPQQQCFGQTNFG